VLTGPVIEKSSEMKRRRVEVNRATTVEASYINIPGVPTGVIPPFLNALKVTTKFFQIKKKEPFSIVDWDILCNNDNNNNNNTALGGRRRRGRITNIVNNCNNSHNNKDEIDDVNINVNVHDTIMNRMESSSAAASAISSSSSTNDELQNKFVQAVQSWIDHVKYLAQREHREPDHNQTLEETKEETAATSSNNNGLLQAEELKKKQKKPIPYSMFLYLWEMQQKHNRVAVRRSALLLSALLLQKSKDCRFHLDQDTCLADWVSNIVASSDLKMVVVWKNADRAIRELPLLHREALSLLDHLIHNGYGRMYAKLGVAAKNLKRQCTSLNISEESDSATTPNSMAIWRKLRDVALLHGEKEVVKVDKLLNGADKCLEILVPRIGGIDDQLLDESRRRTHEDQQKENSSDDHNNTIDECDDDSDDGSGIDWEDGDEVESKHEQYSHLSAVEMTISAMEASGTHEELEINFDRRVNEVDEDNTDNNNELMNGNIRKKLEKTIQKLASRHLIRLSAWLDGLRNSDSLVLMDSASLVALSSKNTELRLKLIKRLSVVKEEVTRVLASASRLNIQVDKRKDQAHIGAGITPKPGVSGLLPPQGIGDVGGRINFETFHKRKLKSKQYRPRIIQINRKK
jgi:hypothetical protein